MTQGETLEELEDNLRDAYRLMIMDDVTDSYEIKEIAYEAERPLRNLRPERAHCE